MGIGVERVFAQTMTSAATLTPAFNLARAWGRVYLEIPTMNSNTQIHIQASGDNTTFRRVYFDSLNSSTVATNVYAIVSAATNCLVPVPPGIQYLKVETTATVDNGAVFRMVCSDEA